MTFSILTSTFYSDIASPQVKNSIYRAKRGLPRQSDPARRTQVKAATSAGDESQISLDFEEAARNSSFRLRGATAIRSNPNGIASLS
jgi:hypothetical protein